MRRTAVGIDLGTTDVFAANVGRKGVDIVQNSVSERRTPALVGFTGRRRLLGDAAFAQVKSNYRNSCRGLKHLVGRTWECHEVEAERLWSLCPLGCAEHGEVGYEVNYRGEEQCVSATVCLSMLITSIVAICKAWTKMDVRDVVLAVPSYFTERVRQACLDALRIAGVHCLRLLHESTAIALAWRYERRNFDDSAGPLLVAFCSAGHSGLLVAIARYEKGAVAVIGEAYDRLVSGRSMDRALMELFAESLGKQGAPDPLSAAKSRLKLEEAATRVKKTLSVVEEARGTAECVVDDYDLSCDVKREEFEERCAQIFQRAKATVARALGVAGLAAKDLTQIEIVGGCSRVPWVQRALREAMDGRELSTTLNADEAVARGCAWQAAMLSPLIRLEQIPLKESGSPAVALEWEDSEAVEAEGSEAIEGGRRRLVVFEAQAGPNVEVEVGLRCRGPLEISAVHLVEDAENSQATACPLGSWQFDFPAKEMEDVELQCSVDINGLFSITKAAVCTGKEAAEAAPRPAAEAEAPKAEAAEVAAGPGEEEAREAEEKPDGEGEAKAAQAQSGEAAGGEEQKAQDAAEEVKEEALPEEVEEEAAAEAAPSEGGAPGNEGPGAESQAEAPEAAEAAVAPEAEATPSDDNAQPKAGDEEEKGSPAAEAEAEAEAEASPLDLDGPQEAGDDDPSDAQGSGASGWRFWRWGRGGKEAAGGAGAAAASGAPEQKRKVGGGSREEAAKVKRQAVSVSRAQCVGLTKEALAEAVQAELAYRKTDEAVVEAENRRNDYETYIFTLREKVSSGDALITEFASPEEREALSKDLEEAESWTYEHIEEDASVFAERLKALRKTESECANRKATLESVEEKVKALKASIKKYKATANAAIYEYIAKEKRESITQECDTNTEWIAELDKRQAAQPRWEAPVFSVAELTLRNSILTKNSTAILSEPRPKPPEPEKKEGKEKKKGSKGDKEKEGSTEAADKGASKKVAEATEGDGANGKKAGRCAGLRSRRLLTGGLALLLAAPAVAALCAGYGKPYGIDSPMTWFSQGDVDFDEATLDLAEGAEPADEAAGEALAKRAAAGEEEL